MEFNMSTNNKFNTTFKDLNEAMKEMNASMSHIHLNKKEWNSEDWRHLESMLTNISEKLEKIFDSLE